MANHVSVGPLSRHPIKYPKIDAVAPLLLDVPDVVSHYVAESHRLLLFLLMTSPHFAVFPLHVPDMIRAHAVHRAEGGCELLAWHATRPLALPRERRGHASGAIAV